MTKMLTVWYDVETRGVTIKHKMFERYPNEKILCVKNIVTEFNQSEFFFDLGELDWYADEDGEDDFIYNELIYEIFKKTKVIINVIPLGEN